MQVPKYNVADCALETNAGPNSSAPKRLLSIAEFGKSHGLCRSRVYQELAKGTLIGIKVGRCTKVPVENAEAWVRSLPAYVPSGSQSKDGGNV